jgi:hypothetical protein
MKRTFKILGLSMAVAAILTLVIVGTIGAAGNGAGAATQTQNQGAECPCGVCGCGNCACGDCDPIEHAYSHNYEIDSETHAVAVTARSIGPEY